MNTLNGRLKMGRGEKSAPITRVVNWASSGYMAMFCATWRQNMNTDSVNVSFLHDKLIASLSLHDKAYKALFIASQHERYEAIEPSPN